MKRVEWACRISVIALPGMNFAISSVFTVPAHIDHSGNIFLCQVSEPLEHGKLDSHDFHLRSVHGLLILLMIT